MKFKMLRILSSQYFPKLMLPHVKQISTQSFNHNVHNALLLKEVDSTSAENDFDYSATHHTVMELLGCSPAEAINIIETDPQLLRLPANDLLSVRKICRCNKIPIDILRKNIWITSFKPVELEHRFIYYWKWNFRNEKERPEILRILSLTLTTLSTYTCRTMRESPMIKEQNRISYYSKHLQASVSDCTDLVIKYPFLMTRNLEMVFDVMNLLLDAGVNPKDIYSDPWPIMNSPAHLHRRIKLMKQNDVQTIKPWMLRCKDSTFHRCIEIRKLAQEVARKFDTKDQYLCNRLKANPIDILENKRKYPRVAQISLSKLKAMLDLLLSQNYAPSEILKNPQILSFSPETIESRIGELRSRGMEKTKLSVLSKRNINFELYLNELDKQLSYSEKS